MGLGDRQIEQIVDIVVNRLQQEGVSFSESPESTSETGNVVDGIFEEIEDAIQAAFSAQKKLITLPLALRQNIIQAIRDTGTTHAAEYGRMEFEETGLGKADDNIKKNQSACQVLGMEDLRPEVFSGDKGVTIIERIPAGVIASVNPVTNGAPTIIFNAIMMLAGGNTVVNNPHPKTKIISARVIRDLNQAIVAAGGPPNCVCCLQEPSVPSAHKPSLQPEAPPTAFVVCRNHPYRRPRHS
jgi:acyl-CoA reductase-like NAD-dependent aldehyde dehydrogenase